MGPIDPGPEFRAHMQSDVLSRFVGLGGDPHLPLVVLLATEWSLRLGKLQQ